MSRQTACLPWTSRTRRALLISASLVLAVTSSGCLLSTLAVLGAKPVEFADASGQDVLLRLSFDKSAFRPGEAVILTATLTNTTDETLRVRGLSGGSGPPQNVAGSVTFWRGRADEERRLERFPVVSLLESRDLRSGTEPLTELLPGQSIDRRFVLTRFTESPGAYVAQIQINPFVQSDLNQTRSGKIYSNVIGYAVHGQLLFDRDGVGLLELEEAINLCAARAPGDIVLADALLIEDEMGFYKWWVNVDYREPGGVERRIAYFVDPYLGRIWSEAQPFDPATHPRYRDLPQSRGIVPRRPTSGN